MLCVWNPIRYQKQKKMMEERTIGVFWGQVQFYFYFFPNRHTLKFLKMNVIQQIKKNCGLETHKEGWVDRQVWCNALHLPLQSTGYN